MSELIQQVNRLHEEVSSGQSEQSTKTSATKPKSEPSARQVIFPFLSYCYVPVNSKTAHPPGQTPGFLTLLKKFGQIPRYVASLDGQMPHPLELQRGSNPP